MTEQNDHPLPCVAVWWRWCPLKKAPVVFPSPRHPDTREPMVLMSELDVEREMMDLTRINAGLLERGGRAYRVSLVPPEEAQAFIDEKAEELVRQATEAKLAMAGDLYAYGFTDDQLRQMGLPVRPKETLL